MVTGKKFGVRWNNDVDNKGLFFSESLDIDYRCQHFITWTSAFDETWPAPTLEIINYHPFFEMTFLGRILRSVRAWDHFCLYSYLEICNESITILTPHVATW
ncbi:hypothetical protein CROQUDRAFT_651791 [Cronartium quercuum f. sp. fusiforme G11]|uniref:Uncharacterized protein n=1 Tax=Cronartium quercuum f. sp. fusiforme G11 TaxID=708437 RepID=A0A9P6TG01_9BASI|nr:hypothetical protein CROQUDRAFT_651791 [Cronartium quercuum f. sp. fusiforme G11]